MKKLHVPIDCFLKSACSAGNTKQFSKRLKGFRRRIFGFFCFGALSCGQDGFLEEGFGLYGCSLNNLIKTENC